MSSSSKVMSSAIMMSMFYKEDDLSDAYAYMKELVKSSVDTELPRMQEYSSELNSTVTPFNQHFKQAVVIINKPVQNSYVPPPKTSRPFPQNTLYNYFVTVPNPSTVPLTVKLTPPSPVSTSPVLGQSSTLPQKPLSPIDEKSRSTNKSIPPAMEKKLHTPIKAPFVVQEDAAYCAECDKKFSKPCYLKQHNNAHHSGPRAHKCSKCGKRFPTLKSLNKHMLNHTDKPFACEYCENTYRHKHDLERHASVHFVDGNKFVCDVCGKGFQRKDHLVNHQNTHYKRNRKN